MATLKVIISSTDDVFRMLLKVSLTYFLTPNPRSETLTQQLSL